MLNNGDKENNETPERISENPSANNEEYKTFLEFQQDLEKNIDHEFTLIGQKSWEDVNTLLDFAVDCITSNQVQLVYSLKVLEIISNLLQNNQSEIKEKCFKILLHFRSYQNIEIKTRANELFHDFSKTQENSIIIYKIVNEIINQPKNENLKNYDMYEIDFIERKLEIEEIHEKLGQNNILTIYGSSGSGKTILALQYCSHYNDFYKIIYQIKSESYKKDLLELAKILEIEETDEEEIQLKLGTIQENVLIFFDNQENFNNIQKLYIELKNIKFLITSRNNEWEEKYEISQISQKDTENLLLGICEEGKEELVKDLLKVVKCWGFGIRLCIIWLEKRLDINEILSRDLESEENIKEIIEIVLNTLSEEALYCIELLGLCRAKNIPEKMIQIIFEEQFNEESWKKVKDELDYCYLIDIETRKMFWNVHDLIHEVILSRQRTRNCREMVLKHFSEYFNVDHNINNNVRTVNLVTCLMSHVENILNTEELSGECELGVSINLAGCYAYLTFEHIKLSKILARIENYISILSYKKISSSLLYKLGNVYARKADFSNAENYFLKCLENEGKNNPINKQSLAYYYSGLGALYQNKGDFLKAGNFLVKSLDIELELFPNDHSKQLNSFNNLGLLFKKLGDYQKAEYFYLNSLEISKKCLQKDDPITATIFNNLAGLYFEQRDYLKSEKFYLESLKIQKKTLPNNHPNVAATMSNLGSVYKTLNQLEKAEDLYLKCHEIYLEIHPENHPSIATSFNNLGIIYKAKGELKKSESFYLKCLEIQQEALPSNHPDLATTLCNIGDVYELSGDFPQAEKSYLLALNIRQEKLSKNHPHLASTFERLGDLYIRIRDYTKAEHYLLAKIKIEQEIYPSNHPFLAKSYRELIGFYLLKPDLVIAESLYMKSLQILQQLPRNHPDLIMFLNDLLLFYTLTKKDYSKAENILLHIINVEQEGLSENDPKLANTFMRLGLFYNITGDLSKAENNLLRCIQIQQGILKDDDLGFAKSYEAIGLLYKRKGDFSTAENYLLRCLKIKQDVMPDNIQSLNAIYKILAEFYKETNNDQKAEEYSSKIVIVNQS